MSKREYRRTTAEQKLEILREAQQPGVTVSEVCRRHNLAPSVLYRWRAVAQSGSATALKRDAQRVPRQGEVEARQAAELALQAGVKRLILTHLSRRYREKDVLAEAQAIFPNSSVARDFDTFQIKRTS